MANTKYTNNSAIIAAYALLKDTCEDTALVEKLAKMAETAGKPKTSADYSKTAAGREVMARAKRVEAYILNVSRPVTSKEIGEKVSGFVNNEGGISYQRVNGATRKCIKEFGTIERGPKVKDGGQVWQTYQPKGYVSEETEED